jgi:glycosyltransferase involved in cell wall biosynthesis
VRLADEINVVEKGVNDFLVDPLSPEQISEALLKLYCDRSLRETLKGKGRLLAENEWRWEKVAQKIIEAVVKS